MAASMVGNRMRVGLRAVLLGGLLALPMACEQIKTEEALPAMRWDNHPEGTIWTTRTLDALGTHAPSLVETVPHDIQTWCPGYPEASADEREAFWTGILSALAKHESTWNPNASGGGGRWIGLLQIAPATARHYGCEATTVGALKNGASNLTCAVQIAAVQVPKDGMVAGNGKQGLGRDWAPFRSSAKRAEMAAWTRQQSYCQG
jgi:hypothetical protein